MNKKKILRWILLVTFCYCWIKFYIFYPEGSSQGAFSGERLKGGFFFHLELFAHLIPIVLLIWSTFCSLIYYRSKKGSRLLRSVLLFLPPFGLFLHQINEPFFPSVFTQTLIFNEADLLWECRILFFIAGISILLSFIKMLYFSLNKNGKARMAARNKAPR